MSVFIIGDSTGLIPDKRYGAVGMFFLKGILIGLIVGLPAGAIGALCIQRMLTYGTASGLITGFGSSVVDCFYAAVGIFGITIISDQMIKYQSHIMLAGGFLILWMGFSTLRKTITHSHRKSDKPPYFSLLVSSLGVGITNPAAVIGFLVVFTYFGIDGKPTLMQGSVLILGVLIGTTIWWMLLALITAGLKKKFGNTTSAKLNRFFGYLMILFSVLLFAKAGYGLLLKK